MSVKERQRSEESVSGTRWFVYMVQCRDGTLYTGVAKDVQRRVAEHNSGGRRAARYTRGRRPILLLHVESAVSRGAALRREEEIKRMSREEKEKLATRWPADEAASLVG